MHDQTSTEVSPSLPRSGRKAEDPRMIGAWKIGRTIGKGSSGRVKIARHATTGQYAAIKIVSKTSLVNSRLSLHNLGEETDRILLSIEREIVIMKLIDHPNIMRLYDVWETSGELYLILEYVEGGELFDYLCEQGRLTGKEALKYFQQIIGAIDYCHRFNIAHRDLKPENLLLDKDKNIKVADFGMAAWQGGSGKQLLETACGSPHYAAPEVIMGAPYSGSSSDIWSCGVILFALLAGRLPFDDENIHVLLDKVKLAKFTMPEDIVPGARDLIRKMLTKDLSKRITMPEILSHPWFISLPPEGVVQPPPSLEVIAKPVIAVEIDADIFGNLRTLWHGAPDHDIMAGLTSHNNTWEKGIYHLLLKYRAKHLEDYVEHESKHARSRTRKQSSKQKAVDAPPTQPTMRQKASQTSLVERSPPPTRPAAPTPRRAGQAIEVKTRVVHAPMRTVTLVENSNSSTDLLRSPMSPMSPIWDALDISPLEFPQSQDESVQRFFQQIADHLQQMQMNALPDSKSPDPIRSAEGRQSTKKRVVANVIAPPPTPACEDIHFGEFLMVDKTDAGLTTTVLKDTVDGDENGPPIEEKFGLGLSNKPRPSRPVPLRPFKKNKAKLGPQPKPKPRKFTNDENGLLQGGGDTVMKKSSLRSSDNSRRTALVDQRVQIVTPAEDDLLTAHRRSALDYMSPTLSDGSSFMPSPSTPRRGWFGNLFKFHPATHHLLSVHDVSPTRDECRRLLGGIGVRTVLVQAEGLGVLKCRLDEISDPAGVMAVAKAVQFRVEVQAPTQAQMMAGYIVVLAMIQEKGALSSFELVCSRVRREWDMDVLRTPLLVHSPALTAGGRFTDVLHAA